jgi:NADH:ubiquinone oxidoreductase subunit 2 (subunit N)
MDITSSRYRAEQCEAYTGLFLDRTYGLSASSISGQWTHRRERRALLSGGLLCHDSGRIRCRHGAFRAERDADLLADYRGLFWHRPALALVFTAMLLSLAGIPLTVRFLGKFYIIAADASVGAWALILILVITSAIGLFYHLRIVVTLYAQPAASDRAREPIPRRAPAAILVLAALTVILVWLGVYPAPLLVEIRAAISSIV